MQQAMPHRHFCPGHVCASSFLDPAGQCMPTAVSSTAQHIMQALCSMPSPCPGLTPLLASQAAALGLLAATLLACLPVLLRCCSCLNTVPGSGSLRGRWLGNPGFALLLYTCR